MPSIRPPVVRRRTGSSPAQNEDGNCRTENIILTRLALMKNALICLTILCFLPVVARADAVVGKPAPDFTGTDINGQTHRLSDYKGKIVVLEEYNLDCPFCA